VIKTFRPWPVEQVWLLPPSVLELVPEDDPAHLVRDLVREELDLSEILDEYDEERGYPPFHPAMMTALLLYAYTQGIYSSRRIARAVQTRVDFMAVTARQEPDFRTIARFRARHLAALAGLFEQVLRLCQRAGMVALGHVALDGTKVKANASRHKAMSYDRMKKSEQELAAEVKRWFAKADELDAAEDREYGERRGDELPDWVKNKQKRLEKIRAAKAELEAEAKTLLATRRRDNRDDDPNKPRGGGKRMPKENGEPNDKAQLNFTDKDSKILKTSDGFVQGYNCQLAVDSANQIIVAHATVNEQCDTPQLPTLVCLIKSNTGRQARELSADAGYLSEANLRELKRRHIRGYIATGRQRHSATTTPPPKRGPNTGPLTVLMNQRLRRGAWRSRYRLRKQVVEPVIGQIKQNRSYRSFLLRGLSKVRLEWGLVCIAHNLAKLTAPRR